MALRVRPHADSTEARSTLLHLAAVTHQLDRVRGNGLPEADYNEGLFELDHSIITSLEADGSGVTVIVETLAGKRTYYAYVTSAAHAEAALEHLHGHFPEHQLSLTTRPDKAWGLYGEYKRLFPW